MRADDTWLIRRQACHGGTRATYPARDGRYGADRDYLQPLQDQGNRRPVGGGGGCPVCHTVDMEDSIHHANMPGSR